jgi:hypothetical protein
MKKVALITIHGIGSTPPNYNAPLQQELRRRLGQRMDEVHVGSVYYQSLMEPNERRVWGLVANEVDWHSLRRFLLFGFADAAGMEANKDSVKSVYTLTQVAMARELYLAYQSVGPTGAVVLLAQSLGGQVMSCYFWDAGKMRNGQEVKVGLWANFEANLTAVLGNDASTAPILGWLQGAGVRHILTTGCNIPLFVAAHARNDILPISPNTQFTWDNYFDEDDVLGWPLSKLSPGYGQVVRDHAAVPVSSAVHEHRPHC